MQNHVEDYQDEYGKWHWRVTLEDETGNSYTLSKSVSGYDDRDEMLKNFFQVYFGDYDESFLSLYNQWDPANNRIGA